MIPLITTLIDKFDSAELVRDKIAAILLVESQNQQVLAVQAGKDSKKWHLRVFTEAANPWSEWVDSPDPQLADAPPIVNVWFDREEFDMRGGDVVERQRASGTFNVDCYGYGCARDDGGSGHVPGDQEAAIEALRAARLARNILMSAHYTYLGMRGVVGRRWTDSIESKPIQIEQRSVQQIHAARLALRVEFNEFSPQVQGVPLQIVSVALNRADNGELLLRAEFDLTAP